MSEAKKKAEELVDKFKRQTNSPMSYNQATQCALIAVDEMQFVAGYMSVIAVSAVEREFVDERKKFLAEVRNELNKM